MITGVHHTCITVSDLDRSVAFYRDVLGLELVMTEESERSLSKIPLGQASATAF